VLQINIFSHLFVCLFVFFFFLTERERPDKVFRSGVERLKTLLQPLALMSMSPQTCLMGGGVLLLKRNSKNTANDRFIFTFFFSFCVCVVLFFQEF
jgi:hypothetical protein